MPAWHSISGYLYYKQGGAFGRLRSRRHHWYLLDDSSCRLHAFRNQQDATRGKPPISSLELQSAAITLSLTESNQFIVTCGGREHVFTAENHESMMIWLLGLQARRESFVQKLQNSAQGNTTKDETVDFKDGRLLLTSSTATYTQRQRRLHKRLSESYVNVGDIVPIGQPLGSESRMSRSLDALRSAYHDNGRVRSVVDPDANLEDSSQEVEEVFDDETPRSDTRCRTIRKTISDITHSKVAALYTAHEGRRSVSEASSDSLGDRASDSELSIRIYDMEQELMDVKCELAEMKNRENCYKAVLERRDAIIVDLDEKLDEMKQTKWDQKTADKTLRDQLRILQNQNHFLNEEIRKLSLLRQQEAKAKETMHKKVETLEQDIVGWRRDYLLLLQSSVRVPTGDLADGIEVRLYGGATHRERIKLLLEEARITNPSLPTFERLACSQEHVDKYGFRHRHDNEGILLHYICQQLNNFYLTQLTTDQAHQRRWQQLLSMTKTNLVIDKELKWLCRHGIPPAVRAEMWQHLVSHHVRELKAEKGACYYSNLCRNAHDSEVAACYRKQISLDLLRTMPNNINFCDTKSQGTKKLQEVLVAFCLHNPAVGYCQSMNFITAVALLFLQPEDAFWTLVAVTEKYFASNYFDAHLSGAQADQDVLKDILKVKIPNLHAHLDDLDIDISTVTLNWFLAIFFDAVPFETLLRIWDCFLLEGPKVLLRFAVAILSMNEAGLLERLDTISIMRHLKACAGLVFDADGLIKTAFEDLKPFPKRQDILTKRAHYMTALQEKLKKKEQQRRAFDETEQLFRSLDDIADQPQTQAFECAATCPDGLLWLCFGDQQLGRMSVVDCAQALMFNLDLQLTSRITCVTTLDNLLILGTLSGQMAVYNTKQRCLLWLLSLHDTVLSMTSCPPEYGCENRLFAGLADGSLAVFENIGEEEPVDEPFYIPIGQGPITTLALIDNQLLCSCGNIIHILHADTVDNIDQFVVTPNPFEHILTVQSAGPSRGLWVAVKGSSVLELWDDQLFTCNMLFDVRHNKHVEIRKEDDGPLNACRITAVLPVGNSLWVGTGDGTLYIYDVRRADRDRKSKGQAEHGGSKKKSSSHEKPLERRNTLDKYKTRSKTTTRRQRGEGGVPGCDGDEQSSSVEDVSHARHDVSAAEERSKGEGCKHNQSAASKDRDMGDNGVSISANDEEGKQQVTSSEQDTLPATEQSKSAQFPIKQNMKIKAPKKKNKTENRSALTNSPTERNAGSPNGKTRSGGKGKKVTSDMNTTQEERHSLEKCHNVGRSEGQAVKDGYMTGETLQQIKQAKSKPQFDATATAAGDNDVDGLSADWAHGLKASERREERDPNSAEREGSHEMNGDCHGNLLPFLSPNKEHRVDKDDCDKNKHDLSEVSDAKKLISSDVLSARAKGHIVRQREPPLDNELLGYDSANSLDKGTHLERRPNDVNVADSAIEHSSLEKTGRKPGNLHGHANAGEELSHVRNSWEDIRDAVKPKYRCERILTDLLQQVQHRSALPPVESSVTSGVMLLSDVERFMLPKVPTINNEDVSGCSKDQQQKDRVRQSEMVNDVSKEVNCQGDASPVASRCLPISLASPSGSPEISGLSPISESSESLHGSSQASPVPPRKPLASVAPPDPARGQSVAQSPDHVKPHGLPDKLLQRFVPGKSGGTPPPTPTEQSVDKLPEQSPNPSLHSSLDQASDNDSSTYHSLDFSDAPSLNPSISPACTPHSTSDYSGLSPALSTDLSSELSSVDISSNDSAKFTFLSLQDSSTSSQTSMDSRTQKAKETVPSASAIEEILPKLWTTCSREPTFKLRLEAKIKISDKAIRCLHLTRTQEEPVIISCSGCFGEDEAVLKWRREPDEKLWTNEPVLEVCPETNQPRPPVYMLSFGPLQGMPSSIQRQRSTSEGDKAVKTP